MKQSTKLVLLSNVAINIATPYLRRLNNTESYGAIYPMRSKQSRDVAFYILPGIVCPPRQEYQMFFDGIEHPACGSAFFVDYGKDCYKPKRTAKLIADHIRANNFTNIRFLTLSIGDQLIPYIAKELDKIHDSHPVRCASWSIDPCISPNTLWQNIKYPLQKYMPLAMALKILLGYLGQQRIIPWDCTLRSYAEIADQAWAIAYHDHSYNPAAYQRSSLPNFFTVRGIIISSDNEFMSPVSITSHYQHIITRTVSSKHCRFSENWHGYLHALASLGFYDD